jgi:predicted CopG family antitoxin
MKKKITLSIDSDVYDQLNDLPRKVSISELVNWVLKAMLQDVKKGKELTSEELRGYVKQTPEGRDFLERFDETQGPKLEYILNEINKIKKAIGLDKKNKK